MDLRVDLHPTALVIVDRGLDRELLVSTYSKRLAILEQMRLAAKVIPSWNRRDGAKRRVSTQSQTKLLEGFPLDRSAISTQPDLE